MSMEDQQNDSGPAPERGDDAPARPNDERAEGNAGEAGGTTPPTAPRAFAPAGDFASRGRRRGRRGRGGGVGAPRFGAAPPRAPGGPRFGGGPSAPIAPRDDDDSSQAR